MAYESTLAPLDFPITKSRVRATSQAILCFEKKEPVYGIPVTEVTYTCFTELDGALPKWTMNSRGVSQLMYLSTMRKAFDRSIDIDARSLAEVEDTITQHDGNPGSYTVEESEIIGQGMHAFDFFGVSGDAKKLPMQSPLVAAKIVHTKESKVAWGFASGFVRAGPEQVLAYMWATGSRSLDMVSTLEKSVDEEPNEHNKVLYVRKKLSTIDDRDFISRMVRSTRP